MLALTTLSELEVKAPYLISVDSFYKVKSELPSLVCTVIVKSIASKLARFSAVACALLLAVSVGYWSSALFVIDSVHLSLCLVASVVVLNPNLTHQSKANTAIR